MCPKLWARDPAAGPRREDTGRGKHRGKDESQRNRVSRQHVLPSSLYLRRGPVPCPQHQWDRPSKILIKTGSFEFPALVTERILTKTGSLKHPIIYRSPYILQTVTGEGYHWWQVKWFFFFFLLFWTVQNFYSECFYHLIFSAHLLVHHYVPKVRRKPLIKRKYIFILYINISYIIYSLHIRCKR